MVQVFEVCIDEQVFRAFVIQAAQPAVTGDDQCQVSDSDFSVVQGGQDRLVFVEKTIQRSYGPTASGLDVYHQHNGIQRGLLVCAVL